MRKNIVIINGSGGVGKDTFTELCGKYLSVRTISSVDVVKQCAKRFGWDGKSKDECDRAFLSDLKILSTKYNNGPCKYILEGIDHFIYSDTVHEVLFIMIREPEEIQKIKDAYPQVMTLLITSDRVPAITTNMADANVDKYVYDYTVDNSGTIDDLHIRALNWMSEAINDKKYAMFVANHEPDELGEGVHEI